jgi:hypothetical protein
MSDQEYTNRLQERVGDIEQELRELKERLRENEKQKRESDARLKNLEDLSLAIDNKFKRMTGDENMTAERYEALVEKYRNIFTILGVKHHIADNEKEEAKRVLRTTLHANQIDQENFEKALKTKIEKLDKFMNDIVARCKSYGDSDDRNIDQMADYCIARNIVPTDYFDWV